jgi:hypothetical protein
MNAENRILPSQPGTLAAVWWGWIIAPGWWLAQFEARYALVLARGACWSAAFFAFLTLAQLLPDLFLDPCRR